MDDYEIPEELISPPERRLTGTMITRKIYKNSAPLTALFLLIVVLFSQFYWLNSFNLSTYLPAVHEEIIGHNQWWRVFTSTLIHADGGHLLSNLYMLGILSFFCYGYFGFLVYPVYTFLGAGFVNYIAILTYPPYVHLLGASGLVYLLGGFWLTLYLFIQRQYSISKRLVRVLGIALMIFFPTSFEQTTSYRTHFIGFLVGISMSVFYFLLNKQKIRSHELYEYHGSDFRKWN
jgi:rhomboid protease GluP